jgi:hypothetical protein
VTTVTATEKPPAGPEAAPLPGPAGPAGALIECGECGALVPDNDAALEDHVCLPATAPRVGHHALYIRHPFAGIDVTGLCGAVELDGDGAEYRCGRPYGEHLPT